MLTPLFALYLRDFLSSWNVFCATLSKSLIMKRLILFAGILFGLATITRAQTTEVKTKIEGHGFKKKIKTEGDAQKVLMSTSAHPAYTHHYTSPKRHTSSATKHVVSRARHTSKPTTYITHRSNSHFMHYKKIKRTHKNGEYKIKYKA